MKLPRLEVQEDEKPLAFMLCFEAVLIVLMAVAYGIGLLIGRIL